MDNNHFSLFYNGISNTYPNEEITIEQFIDKIKGDTPLFAQIRTANTKEERDKLKSKLSYVTFGGVFSYRNANSLIKSSGYACLDVDDVDNLEEIKQKIIQNKFTHCLFTSPSGKGYKFIVKIPEVKSNEEYKQYWVSIARHYNLKDNDEGTKDICRACYLSFDSEPYFNSDSETYTDKADLTTQTTFINNITEAEGFVGIKVENKDVFTDIEKIIAKNNLIVYNGTIKPYKIYHITTQKPDIISKLKLTGINIKEATISGISIFSDKIVCLLDNKKHVTIAEGSDVKKVLDENKTEFNKLIGIKLLFKEEEIIKKNQQEIQRDTSRSAKEFGEVCRLIKKGLSDEEINKEMMAFSKWSGSHPSYKALTIKKARETSKNELTTRDFINVRINSKGKVEESVNIDKVADYIISHFDIQTIYGLQEESVYVYENGIWTIKGRGLIKSEIENILKNYAKNNVVNEISEKIKRKTEVERELFEIVPDYKTCLLNGVLELDNPENISFTQHDKKYNFKRQMPIIFNKEATCPKCLEFINETFYPDDIPQVQEWLGLHLVRNYLFKKAVICQGPKNTGKSVFLNLLTTFLGKDNVSGLSLQKISQAKGFDLMELKDKYANIHDDLSSKDLNDGGGFKMSVGNGLITGEQKFGDHFKFKNTAKQTFACNKIPPVKDIDDEAYYDRFLIWSLENIILPQERDPKLIEKLTTPEELSGLLNWAIEGYVRLMKNNKFSNEKTDEELKSLMIQNGNSLAKFTAEALIQKDGNKISKENMYKVYCKWCSEQKPKMSPFSKEQLGRQLNRFASFVVASSNGSERYWLNVKFNEKYDTYYTSENIMRVFGEGENDNKSMSKKSDMYVSEPSYVSSESSYNPQNDKNQEKSIFLPVDDLIQEVPDEKADFDQN